MIRFISTLIALASVALAAPTYTEFYVQTTGSNLNAGSTTNNSPTVESTNGDWGNAAANRFTAASGTPFSAVSVGDWASVYPDGSSVTVYVARVTAVNGGGASIDLSSTANGGTQPTAAASGITCRIGGAWAGPSGSVSFPFGFAEEDMTDASGNTPRVNIKNGTTYSITATMNHGMNGPLIFSGYTTTPGDGGQAIIDGGTSGTYYKLLYVTGDETPSLATVGFHNLIFQNNGGSGTGEYGVHAFVGQTHWFRCVFREISGTGMRLQGPGALVSCEFYSCNKTNRSLHGGVELASAGSQAYYCISHHNTGTNSNGFNMTTKSHAMNCISWANGAHGFRFNSAPVSASIQHCDSYANSGAGLSFGAGGSIIIENSNFIDNGTYGIDFGGFTFLGTAANNGFGAGSAANSSGSMNTSKGIEIVGTVTYPSDSIPWSGAPNGDFSIDLDEAKGAGRGNFLYTAGTNLMGATPDIGAAQSDGGTPTPPGGVTIQATNTTATTVTIQ